MTKQLFRISGYILLFAAASLPLRLPAQNQSGSAAKAASAVPTPRMANGKVDFSGWWGNLAMDGQQLADTKKNMVGGLEGGNGSPEAFAYWITHYERDSQLNRRAPRNRPL